MYHEGHAALYDDDAIHDRQVSQEELQSAEALYQKHLREYSDAKRKISEQIKEIKRKDPKAKLAGLFDEPDPPIITLTATLSLPWNEDASERLTPAKWDWPATEKDHIRYKIFKSLWEKGFYISKGSKFGGDFLLYPGDPSRFHSNYVVTVARPNQTFSPLDAISMGRLGTTVKKTHAVCSWTDEKGLICICIDWTGWN
jgi:tRNA-splicing endonuclease subunit Sen34